MYAYALDLWKPAAIGGASNWLQNFAARFGGVTPTAYVDFANRRAYQSGVSGVNVPEDVVQCACAVNRYRDDLSGNWSLFAPNTLAYSNKGLRVWEARTNGIRNNSMQGAVAGTPGTPPTNWNINVVSGLAYSVIGIGTENGVDYVDIQITGTATSSANIANFFEGTSVIAAAQNQVWSLSTFVKLISGAFNATPQLTIRTYTSVGAYINQYGYNLTPTATLTRYSNTVTLPADATIAFVRPTIEWGITNGQTLNVIFRVGWPQLEQASFASLPIRTTGAAGASLAEGVTLINPLTFGSAYTLYAAGVPYAPTGAPANQNLLQADAGSDAQRLVLRRQAAGTLLAALVGGTGANMVPAGTWAQAAFGKLACAVSAGDQGAVFNGGVVASAAAAALPITPTMVEVGKNFGSTEVWDGDITEFAIWASTRIPNASLITGTQ